MSAFTPEQLAYLEAHRDDSRVQEIYWVYSVPIAASIISTALRLWAKTAGRNGITLDDYLIVFATLCLVGQCATGLGYGPPHGMGRHVVAVEPHDLVQVRKADYIFSHFYDIALVSVKLGILALYHRVFVVPIFRKFVLATAAFVVAWGIGITVTLLLLCRPLKAYWDPNVTGKCLDLTTFTYFTNISNLITDIWIFLMPVPVIWHLQLQTKKKLLLCFIFCIGLATCIVSSVRLTVVLGHANPDFTWYYVPLGAYSAFEPLGGILCTNLPIIWHMWRKSRPLLPGSSAFASTSTPNPTSTRRSRIARNFQSMLSTNNQTGTDSQSRTILGNEGEDDIKWIGAARELTTTPPQPVRFWSRDTPHGQEMEEPGTAGGVLKIDTEVVQESSNRPSMGPGKRMNGPRSPGMKRNIVEVRKR
ncbi:hypothetical protein BCR34DRAFT_596619 [Clohesyomyces aquaticus]|uniref:Rhodopsin domain-containing protein n=1 Tax=Clohesyomyces aquaticus TaxID=1231657 RepID=A0A1Y2A6B4_9PLEO|nr:hypothetical protein BCR34DRAFT_596619 [Clohesyomyces aquaticus]